MYSDTGSTESVVYDFSSDEEYELNDFDHLLQQEVERQEESLATLNQCYHRLFEDANGPLRSAFPDEYAPLREPLPDLTNILEVTPECVEEEVDGGSGQLSVFDGTEVVVGGGGGEGTVEENLPDVWNSGKERDTEGPSENGCQEHLKRQSPATKFMDKHPDSSLLVEVGLTVNRSALRERHATEFPGIDFIVGYINKDPTGWALLLSEDSNVIAGIKSHYPSHRLATKADYTMFLRSKPSNKTSVVLPPRPPTGGAKKVTKVYSKRMNDSAALADHIKAIGGMSEVVFVFLDVEAAVVQKGCIPLPVEIALVPGSRSHSLGPFHCFIHPGEVTDCLTALRLCCSSSPGSHHVPLRDVKFLRRDYTKIAEEINQYLMHKEVVLVSKGSLMDVQALRWVFAAARALEHCSLPVPALEDIVCFDVRAVKALLLKDGSREKREHDGANASGKLCWYHAGMEEVLKAEIIGYEHSHCALKDAEAIRDEVQGYLP